MFLKKRGSSSLCATVQISPSANTVTLRETQAAATYVGGRNYVGYSGPDLLASAFEVHPHYDAFTCANLIDGSLVSSTWSEHATMPTVFSYPTAGTTTYWTPAEPPLQAINVAVEPSSSPLTGQYEDEYREVGSALSALAREADDDSDAAEGIEEMVYEAATYIAAKLEESSFPAPKIFNHGPKSVVFTWEGNGKSLLVTVSGKNLGFLVSSPEKIVRRFSFRLTAGTEAIAVIGAAGSQYLGKAPALLESPSANQDGRAG